ncbi:hypothetical protein FACS189432_03500 [Bacteroidia bacterium]|nr:hypothetical protein FACS189426_06800 [Bacteroidia bacterium]GHT27291.1 hypothetical protein FACS189432_03500 [Bacteroidia bacterium]
MQKLFIMLQTRSGEQVSAQIGKMGVINNLTNADFSLSDGQNFNVKNDDLQAVILSVRLASMNDGEFIDTRFDPGWNPEIVKVVKQTSLNTDLKYGY